MKKGGDYAKKLKQLFQQLIKAYGRPEAGEPGEPVAQLVMAILADNTSEPKAAEAFERIRREMVDLNELRVTPPSELAGIIGQTVPAALDKAERIVSVLNRIRQRQDTLDLSFIKQRGKREAREYLESIEGLGRAAAARVMTYSLGGHAIPVDDLTLYVLRKEGIVEPKADAADVQGFLEHNIQANDGRVFCLLLNRHVAAAGARVPVAKLPELLGYPKPVVGNDGDLKSRPLPIPVRPPGATAKPGPASAKPFVAAAPAKAPAAQESKPAVKPAAAIAKPPAAPGAHKPPAVKAAKDRPAERQAARKKK